MNLVMLADFPAMIIYTPAMLEDENNRVKSLCLATTFFYIFSGIIQLTFGKFIYSDSYVIWYFQNSWAVWLTYIFLFLGYAWIPLSLFLLFQGFKLRKLYNLNEFTGDRTIGNLAIFLPSSFFAVYILTRMVYGN